MKTNPDITTAFHIDKPVLDTAKLRPWQHECLEQQLAAKDEFFVAAGVGSGKTIQALSFYMAGDFDLVLIVVPKTGIRGSWADDADMLGLRLKPITSGADFTPDNGKDQHGFVLTTGMLASVGESLSALCAMFNVLVVYDEAHHLGEDMTWADQAKKSLGRARFHLALSGTPDSTDNRRILCLEYRHAKDEQHGVPTYEYDTKRSVQDGHTAPVIVRLMGGDVDKVYTDGRVENFSYRDGDYDGDKTLMGERLRLSAVESYRGCRYERPTETCLICDEHAG